MGSGLWEPGSVCCICFEDIAPGNHAEDNEGRWDVHKGECARQAGIVEIPTVAPPPDEPEAGHG